MDSLPKTRAEAIEIGSKTYFTGEPCSHGHISPRRADEGKCVACINERANNRRMRDPGHVAAVAKAFRERHAAKVKAEKKAYYEANRDSILQRDRKKYAESPEIRAKVKAQRDRWTSANLKRKKAADAKWNQENRERATANRRSWKLRNVEKTREYAREAYKRDPDKFLQRGKKWLQDNPEKMAQYNSARRARKLGAEGAYTGEDVKRIFAAQKGRCACCKAKKKLTVDHIVPLHRGGTNWPHNLQGLCLSCNSRKQSKDPIDFMREQGALL